MSCVFFYGAVVLRHVLDAETMFVEGCPNLMKILENKFSQCGLERAELRIYKVVRLGCKKSRKSYGRGV